MMHSRVGIAFLVVVGSCLFAGSAGAHVCNVVMDKPASVTTCDDVDHTPTISGSTVSIVENEFTGYGWAAGTTPTLGDTHKLDGGTFFVFDLSRRSTVTITFAGVAPANFDGAFSLYRGALPDDGHDDTAFDPLNPLDEVTFLPIASPTDAAPWPHYCYRPLDKYRDTLRFTQTGGLGRDGYPLHPFVGQFNALNDFSLANEDAVPGEEPGENWSTIQFVTFANAVGPGKAESLTVTLSSGTYTIAASGANCDGSTAACLAGPAYSAKLSVTYR